MLYLVVWLKEKSMQVTPVQGKDHTSAYEEFLKGKPVGSIPANKNIELITFSRQREVSLDDSPPLPMVQVGVLRKGDGKVVVSIVPMG
jgi:hypothetical protein